MVIGITGSIGAGKNTVSDYLMNHHGFAGAFGSDFIRIKTAEMGLELTRENLRNTANDIRKNFGSLYMLDKSIESLAGKENIVIGYFRTENEVKHFKEKFPDGKILYIEAPQDIRFKRAIQRGEIKDNTTEEEFKKSEELESHSTDPDKQNMSFCKKLSDIIVINTGSKEDLYKEIDKIITPD